MKRLLAELVSPIGPKTAMGRARYGVFVDTMSGGKEEIQNRDLAGRSGHDDALVSIDARACNQDCDDVFFAR